MFIKKLSLSIILSFCLTLSPEMLYAVSSISSNSSEILDLLNQEQEEIKSGNFASDQLNKSGKILANTTYSFINDPKNDKLLHTPSGQQLIKNQTLLTNYLAIKDHLEKCVKTSGNKRDLENRILNAARSSLIKQNDMSLPCEAYNTKFKNFNEFNNNVMKILKIKTNPNFIEDMNKKVLINSMKSLIGIKYKFDPLFMKNGYLTQPELNSLMSKICKKQNCSKLSSGFEQEISIAAINYSKQLKSSENRFNPQSASLSLNQSIDKINGALNNVTVKKESGYIFDSADLSDPNSKKQFDNYVTTYMMEVSKDAGPLLLTSTLRKEAGDLKSFSKDDTEKNPKAQFKFKIHQHITPEQIQLAINEAEEKILNQAEDANTLVSKENARKQNIKYSYIYENNRQKDVDDLVKINPLAAGQLLIQHPEYTGIVCDSINRIADKDVSDEKFDRYFMVGGAIVGGALLLTGVGTVAGAYLLTGSLTAGVAAGTVGGAIMTSTVIAGAVTETANLGYYSKKTYDSYIESNKIEQALLSNNSDNQSIIEKKDTYLAFKESRMKALISLASIATSVIPIQKFFALTRLTQNVSVPQLKILTNIMDTIGETETAKKLVSVASIIGKNGTEKLDEFFLRLATVSENLRLKTLETLKNHQITPQKLKEIFEKSLEAAQKCTKV